MPEIPVTTEVERENPVTVRGVLAALAVLVVLVNSVILWGIQEKAECQAEFSTAAATVISIRSGLAERADKNQNELLGGVARLTAETEKVGDNPSPAQEKKFDAAFRKLLADFAKEAAEISKARDANPPPPIPDCAERD